MIARAKVAIAPWLRELGGEPTVLLAGAAAALVVSHYQGSVQFFRETFGSHFTDNPWNGALPYFWWFGSSLVLYMLLPIALSYGTKGTFVRRFGLGLGDWKAGVLISALFLVVMLPAVFVASKTKAFAGQYPLAGQPAFTAFAGIKGKESRSYELFLVYELLYFSYFIGWEFLYRGWLLNGLLPHFGRGGAILIQMVPFALMHLGKPEPEALGSIIAGLALGILALRTRSFWYGAVLHGSIAVAMDLLSSWPYLARP
ncbi:MAG: CPBP family intramembrane glutamic endopeptidase [Myxococcaceae bacterium]